LSAAVSREDRMRTVSRFGRCLLASRAYRWTFGSRAIICAAYRAKWSPDNIAWAFEGGDGQRSG